MDAVDADQNIRLVLHARPRTAVLELSGHALMILLERRKLQSAAEIVLAQACEHCSQQQQLQLDCVLWLSARRPAAQSSARLLSAVSLV